MALAGAGLLGLWFDIAPERLDDFYEWHNREHIPERLGNAGFLSGRRFRALRAERQFMVLYETRSPDTVSGPEYMNCIRFESEWSLRHDLINNSRAIFRVLCSYGQGQGGSALSIRFTVQTGREEEMRRLLAHRILPPMVDVPGIAGARLLRIDQRAMHASANQGIQFKVEPGQEIGPDWLIVLEGNQDPQTLDRAVAAEITDEVLASAGAETPARRGLYAFQYGLTRHR
jgi:hypothetical protein